MLCQLKERSSQADVFLALLTKGDFRKQYLLQTPENRFKLSKMLTDMSGGIIQVPPFLPEDIALNSVGRGLNGEEKILPLIKVLGQSSQKLTLLYGAGGDHFLSFARNKNGKVLFATITDQNIEDFRYYVRMDRYQELLKKLVEIEDYSIPAEKKEVVSAMIQSSNPEDFLVKGASFPVLDTIGKLWIIQGEVGENIQFKFLYTSRGSDLLDPLRDALAVPFILNRGLEYDLESQGVSSSRLRNGLVRLAQDGIFDADLMAAFPLSILKWVLAPENRDYLYDLIGEKNGGREFGKSTKALLPRNFTAENSHRERLHNTLIQKLRNFGVNIEMRESQLRENPTIIEVFEMQAQDPLVSFQYSVLNEFRKTTINVRGYDVNTEYINENDKKAIWDLLVQYAKDINQTDQVVNMTAASPIQQIAGSDESEYDAFEQRPFATSSSVSSPVSNVRKLTQEETDALFIKYRNEGILVNVVSAVDNNNRLIRYDNSIPWQNLIQRIVNGELIAVRWNNENQVMRASVYDQLVGIRLNESTFQAPAQKGGIDFNPEFLDLQIKRDGNGVPLPINRQPVQWIERQIQGIVPVIINVAPVTNLPMLLGVAASDEKDSPLTKFLQQSPMRDPQDLLLASLAE
jgi:hypothetical protein